MPKLGNQPSVPNIAGTAYKQSPTRIARIGLSGDSDTSPMNIGTGSVLIHEATPYAYDEVFLWVSNYSNTDNKILTLEVGGSGDFSEASKTIKIDVDKEVGLMQVYPGIPHKDIKIFAKADATGSLNLFGYVDRHYRLSLTDETLGYDANSE
jgi:hypothetical protein|tara:strand:- start:272 stop:727 length:456 start_codon:yes stop_codon:yes gene_type:complete